MYVKAVNVTFAAGRRWMKGHSDCGLMIPPFHPYSQHRFPAPTPPNGAPTTGVAGLHLLSVTYSCGEGHGWTRWQVWATRRNGVSSAADFLTVSE